jgi:hypothetical protein
MLRLAQHDKTSRAQHSFFHSAHSVSSFRALFFVIPSILFLSFRASARNPAHRCFASLSMTRPAVPSTLFFIPRTLFRHSAHSFLSFRAIRFIMPSILFLSFRASARNPAHGCFTSLSMTRPAVPSTLFFIPRTLFRHSELSFLSFRAYFFVIPSVSEESSA